jgi:hypothetical protein
MSSFKKTDHLFPTCFLHLVGLASSRRLVASDVMSQDYIVIIIKVLR